MKAAQQEQHIAGQVSQGTIPQLIFAPAPINLPPIGSKPLPVPCSFGMIFRQRVPFLFIPGNLFLQFVNLSARTGLSAIKTACI